MARAGLCISVKTDCISQYDPDMVTWDGIIKQPRVVQGAKDVEANEAKHVTSVEHLQRNGNLCQHPAAQCQCDPVGRRTQSDSVSRDSAGTTHQQGS